jgi:hypothetical protein
MTKDDVIKALSLCRYDPDPGQECKQLVSCDICPYWSDETGCRMTDLFTDAIALLKEEPRPLSLEDVLGIYHALDDHVWPYNTPPYLWCEVNRKMYDAFSGWVTWREVMSIIERVVTLRPYSIDNYGELWTLYLRRPDKEDTKCET